MGTLQQVLWLFLWRVLAVQSFQPPENAAFPQDLQGLFDDNWMFPFEGNMYFPSLDTIFSSWQQWTPDVHMLADFPPTMNGPRVQVFCDATKLTLLVDKKAFGLTWTAEDIHLGNGCFSNDELPNQLVFVYNLDQCGTIPVLRDGLQAFTNKLHLNPKRTDTLRHTLPTIHIACVPKRSSADPNFISQPSWAMKKFDIQAMNPSWTETAESNVYKRGLVVRLQVSAETRPGQQLFIHSCFVSASPEPQARPRHAVILNKGCASSLGSPHTVALFKATNRADVVNFMLNTSYLITELYVHCTVALSDQGVNTASKSCNYNVTRSRWEEVSGDTKVCACCSSKCKGQSVHNFPDDLKGVVSIGPLFVVDDWKLSPALPESEPLDSSGSSFPATMMTTTPGSGEDWITSGASLAQHELQSSPQGVLMVRQEPTGKLTLWLPGQVQGDNLISQSNSLLVEDDFPVQGISTTHGNSLNLLKNETDQSVYEKGGSSLWDMNLVTLVNGWQIPQRENKIGEELQKRSRYGRSGISEMEATLPDFSLPKEINVNLLLVEKPKVPNAKAEKLQMRWSPPDLSASSELPKHAAVAPEVPVLIRTKLEFSKSADGSKRLSYEEVKQEERKHAKDDSKRKPRLKGLRSTFLDLLRRMDKNE